MPFLTITKYRNHYCERTTTISRHLEKLMLKLTKIETHIQFLQECKKHNVIPRGMSLKCTSNVYKNKKLIKETMYKVRDNILESRLKQLRQNRINVKTQRTILEIYMKTEQPLRDHHSDLSWINQRAEEIRNKLKNKHDKKLKKLIDSSKHLPSYDHNKNDQQYNKNIYVINKSSKMFSEQQLKVLEKALKYVPTPKSINLVDIITNVETSLNSTPKIIKQTAISEITEFVQKWRTPK